MKKENKIIFVFFFCALDAFILLIKKKNNIKFTKNSDALINLHENLSHTNNRWWLSWLNCGVLLPGPITKYRKLSKINYKNKRALRETSGYSKSTDCPPLTSWHKRALVTRIYKYTHVKTLTQRAHIQTLTHKHIQTLTHAHIHTSFPSLRSINQRVFRLAQIRSTDFCLSQRIFASIYIQ